MTNHAERKWRMQTVLEKIPKKETKKEKIIGLIMYEWGFSRRTTLEYLKALIDADFVREGKGNIWRK